MTPKGLDKTLPRHLAALLLWALAACIHAAPVDLVLLLDASASIARDDPGEQRLRLARALVRGLGKDDRATVIAFDETLYPLTPWLRAGDRDARRRLLEAIDLVPAGGFYSDIPGALEEAAARLWGRPERAKAIVLISDGRIALADEGTIARHTQYLMFELVPRLAKRKVRLFTVDPGGRGNESLLRLLAEDGRGFFLALETGRSVTGPARRILALAHRGGTPPRQTLTLEMPSGVQSAVISARPTGKAVLELVDPAGKRRQPQPKSADGRLYVHLEQPAPGRWTVRYRHLEDIRLYADPTVNLQLQAGEPVVGGELHFAAWVQDHGGADDLLKSLPLRLTLRQADGNTLQLPLNDRGEFGDPTPGDGIYGGLFTPTQPGPLTLTLETHLGPYRLASEHILDIQPAPAPPPASPPQTPPAEHEAPGHESPPEHPAEASPPAEEEPPAEEDGGPGLVFWLSLVWILLVLGGGAAGLWWWLKKKRGGKKKKKDGDDEDEAVDIEEEAEGDD